MYERFLAGASNRVVVRSMPKKRCRALESVGSKTPVLWPHLTPRSSIHTTHSIRAAYENNHLAAMTSARIQRKVSGLSQALSYYHDA